MVTRIFVPLSHDYLFNTEVPIGAHLSFFGYYYLDFELIWVMFDFFYGERAHCTLLR